MSALVWQGLVGVGQSTGSQSLSFAGIRQRPVPDWHCMQSPLHALSQQTPLGAQIPLHGVPPGVQGSPKFRRHCPLMNCCVPGQTQLPVLAWQVRPPVQLSQHWLLPMQRPSLQARVFAAQPQVPALQARLAPGQSAAVRHSLQRLSARSQRERTPLHSGAVEGQQAPPRFWMQSPPVQSIIRWPSACSGQPQRSPSMHT